MTVPNRLLALALALALAGCSSVSVKSDYDPGTDFAALGTWDWLHDGPSEGVDELTDRRIRAAVEAELPAHGLRPAPGGEAPDVRVAYHANVRQQIEIAPEPVAVGYGWRRGFGEIDPANVWTYDEGTLVLDFVAKDGETLLWRGTATEAVTGDPTPEERRARIQSAVEAILGRYPPKR